MTSLCVIQGLVKRFASETRGDVTVFDGLSIDFPAPDSAKTAVFAILGKSGVGKTTLLNLIGGLDQPDAGKIEILGAPPSPYGSVTVLMPQGASCFPWLSVIGNVEFGLRLRGVPRPARRAIALELVRRVGLTEASLARPAELSGGMQQRVALARTLAIRPQLLLLDEPFVSLDPNTRDEMHGLLIDTIYDARCHVICVTHNPMEAAMLADVVYILPSSGSGIPSSINIDFPRPRPRDFSKSPTFWECTRSIEEALTSA